MHKLISAVVYKTTSPPPYFIQCNNFTEGKNGKAKPLRALDWFESVFLLLWEEPGSGSWGRSETTALLPAASSLLATQLDMHQETDGRTGMQMQRIRARVRGWGHEAGKTRTVCSAKTLHAVTHRMESFKGREGMEDGRHTPTLEAVEMAK